MLSNKRIKKELNKELKPTVSADQFCLEAGITFKEEKTTKYVNGKKLLTRVFLPIASILAVCLCIILPITFGSNDVVVNNPIKYGENNISYKMMDIESIFADEKVMGFSQSYVYRCGSAYLITPIGSSTKLGYRISDLIYAEVIDGVPSFAFSLDFFVRIYDNYTVSNEDIYTKAEKQFTQNDINFKYCIIGENGNQEAYITFEFGNYDYFIRLSVFGQFTEINDDSVELFLLKAFTEEKQKDETVSRRQVDS